MIDRIQEQLNIGFVGFRDAGKSTLIDAILGSVSTESRYRSSILQSSTFDDASLNHVILWEISYPMDANDNGDEREHNRRKKSLRNLFM